MKETASAIRRFSFDHGFGLLLLGLLALVLLIPLSPYFRPFPGIDSSVFIYVGQRILDGQVPYLDVWDHKGPVIHYLNALGQLLVRNSFWGAWLVELLSLVSALLLAYAGLSHFLKKHAVLTGVFTGFLFFTIQPKGNFTEEYSLLPIFAALYIFIRSQEKVSRSTDFITIGLLSGVTFLLRPNNVGYFLDIGIVLLATALFTRRVKLALIRLGWMAIGFLAIQAVTMAYFASRGALFAYVDAVFRFNFLYAAQHLAFVEATLAGIAMLPSVSFLAMAGMMVITVDLIADRNKPHAGLHSLRLLILLSLPLAMAMTALSARGFAHYYLLWIPAATMQIAYLADWVIRRFEHKGLSRRSPLLINTTLLVLSLGLFGFTAPSSITATIQFFRQAYIDGGIPHADVRNHSVLQVRSYFLNHSFASENPYLLVWGNDVLFNLVAQKVSPARYISRTPLATPGYTTESMALELLEAIKNKQPLILETADSLPIGDPYWDSIPGMGAVMDYIEQNYVIATRFTSRGFPLYVVREQFMDQDTGDFGLVGQGRDLLP
jgi:hypothetical protein